MEKKLSIEVKDCVKIYDNGLVSTVALRKLKCNFYEGEICVIMGPSGSGKTTFLNILGGLEKYNSGEIFVTGLNLLNATEQELESYRSQIGYVFQFFNLIPELTASENIAFSLILHNVPKKQIDDRVQELLNLVDLSDRSNHLPSQLSGGEQQRIAFCSAIANKPQFLLCDEPTGELDTKAKYKILNTIKMLNTQNPTMSIIIVSHDMIFKEIADRVLYIKDGEIIHQMEQKEFKVNRPENPQNKKAGESKSKDYYELIEKENYIEDLRQLQQIIKEKLDKIEN